MTTFNPNAQGRSANGTRYVVVVKAVGAPPGMQQGKAAEPRRLDKGVKRAPLPAGDHSKPMKGTNARL